MRFHAVIIVVSLVLCAGAAFTQIPPYINYQGVLTGPDGQAVPDGMYGMGFVLFDAPELGTPLYEMVSSVQVTKGIFNVQIGPTELPFDRQYWLGIVVGEEPMLSPRVPLVASPYCFTAQTVMDNAITTEKIAEGHVVRSINGLRDNVGLAPGANITITPAGNELIIAATGGGGGISGSGSAGQVAIWDGTSSITGDDWLYWDSANRRLGIGTTGPNARLRVESSNEQFAAAFASTYQSDTTEVIRANYLGGGSVNATAVEGISLPDDGYGIGGDFTGGLMGLRATANGGNHPFDIFGISASASGTSMDGSHYGVYGFASGPTEFGNNYGVAGLAMGEGYSNVGVHGTASGDDKEIFGVIGHAIGSGDFGRYGVFGHTLHATDSVYAGYFAGNLVYTGGLYSLSDEMFKTNLAPFDGALDKILALEPKKYNYTLESVDARVALPRGEHYGLVAQDVEKVIPELVGDLVHPRVPMLSSDDPREESFGYKGINYVELIPILVQAIKEQQVTIEELKAEVQALKNR
jgi:hypothetical protein